MPARMLFRWTGYAGVSTALAGFVIVKALAQRPNFYSAAVYLSQSSANLIILTNLVFVTACTFLFGLQKLLYGPLRPIEVEQLYEKAWFAVTETCLAMTIFRGEMGPWFLVMFFSLLAGKVWGWIGEGRVEILEQQPPRNPRLFHMRLALSLGLSVAFDLIMLEYIVKQVMRMAKPDMMVMFGFEFAVLAITSISTAARYAINLVEIGVVREQKRSRGEAMRKERVDTAKRDLESAERRAAIPNTTLDQDATDTAGTLSVDDARAALRRAELPVDENEVEVEGWEAKGRWVFYLDLATDFFKLVVYMSFFIILLVFYGLPIHIMRDVFLTTRSFFKRIADFLKYRTATRDMNERYPDANADEIGREDVCIICREEMRPYQPPAPGQPPANPAVERMRPKKLPCGHVLHFACLRSWLERQQVCPTCRRSVVPTPATGTAANPGMQGNGQAGQHPPGERPGPRVYQFGPLRIGVGAARGNNMFEDLQRQLAEGRAAPAARADQNGQGPQQYGFGIRWEGRHRPRRRHRSPQGTLREQLDSIAQQIRQETQALQDDTREYTYLREMQAELDRLRASRAQAPAQAPASGVVPPPGLGMPPVRPTQVLHATHQDQTIQAGSDQLPPGLTLPEGWTMMPLRPAVGAPLPAQAGLPQFPPRPTGPQNAHGPVPPPPAQATNSADMREEVRAMFSLPGQPGTNGANVTETQRGTATGESTSTTVGQGRENADSPEATNGIDTNTIEATAPSNRVSSGSNDLPVHTEPEASTLPSWGSPPTSQSHGNVQQDRAAEPVAAAPTAQDTAETSTSSRSKQASVEDTPDDQN